MQVDLPHKVDTRHDAVCVTAGDIQLTAGLETDGHIETLIALLAQLRDGHVFSDLHAAAELDTEFTQDVDFCLHHVFFEAKTWNAVHQHAAGTRFPFKHRRAVALFSEVVCARQARGAAADDGDLLGKFAVDLRNDLFGHKARFRVHVLLGDEALDLVNGDGLINRTARAGILAAAVADAAADRGERIFALDELQRLAVLALRGELQIALHRDVRWASRFARRGTGIVAVDAVPVAVVDAPLFRPPLDIVG